MLIDRVRETKQGGGELWGGRSYEAATMMIDDGDDDDDYEELGEKVGVRSSRWSVGKIPLPPRWDLPYVVYLSTRGSPALDPLWLNTSYADIH